MVRGSLCVDGEEKQIAPDLPVSGDLHRIASS